MKVNFINGLTNIKKVFQNLKFFICLFKGEYDQNQNGSLVRHGEGVLTCQNGIIYTGNWADDKLNGLGSYQHPSGMKYEGEFVDGKFEGPGKYTWPDGFNYEGEFKASKLFGKGYLKDPAGQMWTGDFEGDFANGLKFKLSM